MNYRVYTRTYAALRIFIAVIGISFPIIVSSIATAQGEADRTATSAVDHVPASGEKAGEGQSDSSENTQPLAMNVPKATPVELGEPITEPEVMDTATADSATDGEEPQELAFDQTPPLLMLDTEVPPGTATRLAWAPAQFFEGLGSPTPVLVVHGAKPGPILCLTGAIHGDELNGIEIVRRVLYNIEAEDLSGSVIGVPIVNLQGFQRRSRYMLDRRDLNRLFPGLPNGSSGARVAHSFFTQVVAHCTALVDLHTGSFHRTNLPQLRADLSKPEVEHLSRGFGATVVLQSEGGVGTLRRAAVDTGIPAVTLESGEPLRLQEDIVKHSVKSIRTLMHYLGMVKKAPRWGKPESVYYDSTWVRAERGGILFSEVELGALVDEGDFLGAITNPITNVRFEIRSNFEGRVLGMALDQVVMPGYAVFHIGISKPKEPMPAAETGQAIEIIRDNSQERRSEEESVRAPGDPFDADDGADLDQQGDDSPRDEPYDSN